MDNHKIDCNRFYDNYYGHRIEDLEYIVKYSKQRFESIIYLTGDSTLDNKYWLNERIPMHEKLREVMNREYPKCRPDIAHCINTLIDPLTVCINCAVEEATVESKSYIGLNAQDLIVMDNLNENDILVVSICGNDIALKPTLMTIFAIGSLLYCTPNSVVKSGYAIQLWYLMRKFRNLLMYYIKELTSKTKPRAIILCSIYYPCIFGRGWADKFLNMINYTNNPLKIHSLIDHIHSDITKSICLDDSIKIYPLELSKVLDFNDESDYVSRVEPSYIGGMKIANAITNIIFKK